MSLRSLARYLGQSSRRRLQARLVSEVHCRLIQRGADIRTFVVRSHPARNLDVATRRNVTRRRFEEEHRLLRRVIAELLDVFRVIAAYRDYLTDALSLRASSASVADTSTQR